jgi:hypothetical protein
MRGHSIGQREQSAQLTQLRRDDPRMASVYRELEDAGLHRLELAFGAFFRRHKRHETPGPS